MTCSIVYNSRTGNTAMLAEEIRGCLPSGACSCFGPPDAAAPDADFIFAGFWTDRGDCGGEMASYLCSLRNKKVFLFGTAGFGGSPDYFAGILARVSQRLDASNTLAGSFMCQGKMPPSVRQKYEALSAAAPKRAEAMLANFDRALPHPDEDDLRRLRRAVEETLRALRG